MRRVVLALSALVRRAPVPVVVVVIALTAVLGWFSQDIEQATGNEGFAPDNPEIDAAQRIGDRFGSSNEAVLQVLVRVEDGIVSSAGIETVQAIERAVRDSPSAPYLSDREDRPAVLSPLGPLQGAIAQGAPADDDDSIRGLFAEVNQQLPPAEMDFVAGLLPDGANLDDPDSDRALMVVFIEPPEGSGDASADFDRLVRIESDAAAAISGAEFPQGASATAFAFELLFDDSFQFEQEITRLFATAAGIILVILAFVYWVRPSSTFSALRSGRRAAADVALTMATIIMAITWMNGAAALLGPGYADVIGALTEVTQVLPVLLVGLGVDYGIHLTSRYREEVAGRPVSESVGTAVRTVGIALVLATMTTAVGFLTNIVNPVPALRDFGVLAAVGIASSFLLMLTFVPAIRLMLDRRAERRGRLGAAQLATTSQRLLPQLMARTSVLAQRAPVPTLLVTVLLGGSLGVYGLTQLETRFSFTDFVPDDSPLIATLEEIQDSFGGGFGETTSILIEGDVATPAAHNALVAATEDLAELDVVPALDGRATASSPATLLGALLEPGPEGAPLSPDIAALAAAQDVRPDLSVPPDADVEALYEALWQATGEQAEAVLARDDDGRFGLALLDVRTSAGEQRAGELIDGLADVLAPFEGAGLQVTATSNEIINEVIVSELSESQVSSLVVTLAAALVLLVVTFAIEARRPMLGVLTIAPVGLVVLWTFGAMAATDIPFGPVTATIAALAIGIGVPYMIHVANRFREDRARLPLDEAIASTVRNTGGALAGSAFTTMAGFGVLVTSSLTPFRQFGFVTAFAIGFALVAATIVLPSLLVLWDRYHRLRGRESGFGYQPRHSAEHRLARGEPSPDQVAPVG